MTRLSYVWVGVLTAAYWGWEAQAAGNIRVDLLVIYPLLFCGYLYLLWQRLRWVSVPASILLMALNMAFFVNSYAWFHKHSG